MPQDVFDTIDKESKGDVFDQIHAASTPPDTRTLAQRQADSKAAADAAAPQYGSALFNQIKQNWANRNLGPDGKPMQVETGMDTPESRLLSLAVPLGAASEGMGAMEAFKAGPIPSLFQALKTRVLPSAAHAGAAFNEIEQAAGSLPTDTSKAYQIAEEAKKMSTLGASPPPKPIADLLKLQQPGAVMVGGAPVPIEPPPLPYSDTRVLASNAGDLAGSEKLAMNDAMKAKLGQFYGALKDANRDVAAKVGMGDLYDAAINEYRRAKTVQDALAVAKKWGVRAALTAVGLKAGYSLWNEITGK